MAPKAGKGNPSFLGGFEVVALNEMVDGAFVTPLGCPIKRLLIICRSLGCFTRRVVAVVRISGIRKYRLKLLFPRPKSVQGRPSVG